MELSDLLELKEIPRGTIVTGKQLETYGLYGTSRKLGSHLVYWGQNKGTCLVDEVEKKTYRVYLHTKPQSLE